MAVIFLVFSISLPLSSSIIYRQTASFSCKLWQVPNVFLQMYIWFTWAVSRCHPAWRLNLQTGFPVHNVRASSVGRTIFIRTWSMNVGSYRDFAVLIVYMLRRKRPTFAPIYAGSTTAPKSTWSTSSFSNAVTEEKFCCLSNHKTLLCVTSKIN